MIRIARSFIGLSIGLSMAGGALLGACNGCRPGQKTPDSSAIVADAGVPSFRLYVVSDLAGALEPCGCQKDMLGGLDHLGAYVAKERDRVKQSAIVAVGPTFFMDEEAKSDRTEQDVWKAEAIAGGLKNLGLAGIAPGKNDFSQGAATLNKLRELSGAPLLAGNLSGETAGAVPYVVKDYGGIKVGFVGVSLPKSSRGGPKGVILEDAKTRLAEGAAKARREGARIVVALAAIDRGEAVRMAETVTDLDAMVVGSPSSDGDSNDEPRPPRFVGHVLVVQPSNHLTRVAVLDFHIREGKIGEGSFSDGSGLAHTAEVADLSRQVSELEKRIAVWEKDPNVAKTDVDAQRTRLVEIKDKLAKTPAPALPAASFVRYQLLDVKKSLGTDKGTADAMSSFYKRVNETNRTRLAGKRAPVPGKDEAHYVGIATCKTCHPAAYDVWSKHPHSHAYKTLSDESKEFNLECVSCHVTAYEKPGGSSVTDVAELKDVQCEQCHGPGSKHVNDPYMSRMSREVSEGVCVGCHHPPHVDSFDYKERVKLLLGPGHGKPGAPVHVDPPKGWKPPAARF